MMRILRSEMREELYKDLPERKGWYAEATDVEQAKIGEAWSKMYEELYPIEEQKEKALHDKYYSKYGL